MSSEQQLVIFELGGQEYGLPIKETREIIRLAKVSKLPGAPAHMEGIINLRGSILPVINLSRLLDLPLSDQEQDMRIIVAEHGDRKAGLIVGRVNEVGVYSEEELETPLAGDEARYIKAVINKGNRLWLLLNLEKVFS
ncbi:purine-binding chemotaxis protein CheW [Desulfofundulus luciae]|uniref:Purine-binding chemotaxis protein CheW n=1 Tax=Desulfofundulus luciae TaxID=74702 RepID=A0ABU0B3E6_9FIRM|nr:chemotaxis protein CheW [Desulfofundulus luciae]MDQ0286809.1 purine-binding chemotaxis protein CheW [Desulfofundulus luciae]